MPGLRRPGTQGIRGARRCLQGFRLGEDGPKNCARVKEVRRRGRVLGRSGQHGRRRKEARGRLVLGELIVGGVLIGELIVGPVQPGAIVVGSVVVVVGSIVVLGSIFVVGSVVVVIGSIVVGQDQPGSVRLGQVGVGRLNLGQVRTEQRPASAEVRRY